MSDSTSPTTIPAIALSDGHSIPQLGYGTYQVPPKDAERIVEDALGVGYRHIDTAQLYENEAGVGRAVAAANLPREELWITTKLGNGAHRRDAAIAATEKSLELLDVEYLDLYLVHWPLPMYGDVAKVWEVMCELVETFPIRSIGVSNFQPAHLDRIAEAGLPIPCVNQVESNPYFSNEQVRAYDQEHGIVTQAWSPLAQGAVFADPQVAALAEQRGRTISQIVLRWVVQRGDVVFPKSSSVTRMEENLRIFDFELSEEEMAAISALHSGERSGPDPDSFDWRG